MKGGPVLFLVLLLCVSFSVSTTNYLTFLQLDDPDILARGDDYYSSAITSLVSIRFGYYIETTLYVSTNGYFSIRTTPQSASLGKFSSSRNYSVVAPFAADIDTSSTGSVQYQIFINGSSNINTVSSYIRSELGVSFYGSWMLVAEWSGVPLQSGFISTTNTFQGVIITDGSASYAVFLYFCPFMEWSGKAVIGWQASSSYYRNYPLSGTSDAKEVACLNIAISSYNTVLFKLGSVSTCTNSIYFGCFDGTCEYAPSGICDGDSDCLDGSDEVACSLPSNVCDSDEFQCDNGACEPSRYKCNSYDDCGDNSDEQGCVSTGLILGLVFGLSILIIMILPILILVYVGCFCPLRRRKRRSINSSRSGSIQSTISRPSNTFPLLEMDTSQTTSTAASFTRAVDEYFPVEESPGQSLPPSPKSNDPANLPTPQSHTGRGTTVVTTAQTTSVTASATQTLEEYYPVELEENPEETPPTPSRSNPIETPFQQPNTGRGSRVVTTAQTPSAVASATQAGEQYLPAEFEDIPPTDARDSAGFMPQQ